MPINYFNISLSSCFLYYIMLIFLSINAFYIHSILYNVKIANNSFPLSDVWGYVFPISLLFNHFFNFVFDVLKLSYFVLNALILCFLFREALLCFLLSFPFLFSAKINTCVDNYHLCFSISLKAIDFIFSILLCLHFNLCI